MKIKVSRIKKILSLALLLALTGGALLLTASPVSVLAAPESVLERDTTCPPETEGCVVRCSDPALNAPHPCTGQTSTSDSNLNPCTKESDCNVVQKYLNPFIKFMTYIVGIAVAMGIIIGGIQYSSSGGDPQKAATAKQHIRNSLIALLAFFFLWAFIQFLTPGGGLTTG